MREWLLKTVEEIKAAIEAAVPGAGVTILPNPGPSGQHSLLLAPGHAIAGGGVSARRCGTGARFSLECDRRGLARQGDLREGQGDADR